MYFSLHDDAYIFSVLKLADWAKLVKMGNIFGGQKQWTHEGK